MKNMKRIGAAVLALVLCVGMLTIGASATVFTDTENHWAKAAIDKWSNYGVVNGYGNNEYRPDANLTRAEAAQIYVNLLKLESSADLSAYTDAPAAAWKYNALAKTVAANLIAGTTATTLGPDETITREQFFVIFDRALLKDGQAETAKVALPDASDAAPYAAQRINYLINAGYVNGRDGKLMPKAPITRAEVVALLNNTIAVYANEAGKTVKAAVGNGITLVVADDVTLEGVAYDLVLYRPLNDNSTEQTGSSTTNVYYITADDGETPLAGNAPVGGGSDVTPPPPTGAQWADAYVQELITAALANEGTVAAALGQTDLGDITPHALPAGTGAKSINVSINYDAKMSKLLDAKGKGLTTEPDGLRDEARSLYWGTASGAEQSNKEAVKSLKSVRVAFTGTNGNFDATVTSADYWAARAGVSNNQLRSDPKTAAKQIAKNILDNATLSLIAQNAASALLTKEQYKDLFGYASSKNYDAARTYVEGLDASTFQGTWTVTLTNEADQVATYTVTVG